MLLLMLRLIAVPLRWCVELTLGTVRRLLITLTVDRSLVTRSMRTRLMRSLVALDLMRSLVALMLRRFFISLTVRALRSILLMLGLVEATVTAMRLTKVFETLS